MQVQSLQPGKDVARAILILGLFHGVNIGEHRVTDHLQLVVSCDKPGQINALRPRRTRLADRFKVVHVHNLRRYLLQAHRSNVEAAAGSRRFQTALQDPGLGLVIFVLVEGVIG